MTDYVAAIVGPDKVELFLTVQEAKQTHPKAMIFDSWEKMAKIFEASEMDIVRSKLLYFPVSPSRSREEAAKLLWRTFGLALPVPGMVMLRKLPRERDKLGNVKRRRFSNRTELVFLAYKKGEDPVLDRLYARLSPQARTTLDLLLESGKKYLDQSEVLEILRNGRDRLKTKQSVDHLWGWHCSQLVNRRMIKKVGFDEYAELKGLAALE